MTITELSLRKKTVTLVLLILLILGGLYSYFTLPQAEDPGFTVRAAQVITLYPGASPERVRDTVTIPLEDAIGELGELEHVTSRSQEGVSIITATVAFEYGDLEAIWDKLADAVDAVREDLPEGALTPRIEDDYGDVFSILLSLTGEGYSLSELDSIAREVRRKLMGLSEVSRVDIYGVPDREVLVSYQRETLEALGLTPYHLATAVQKTNVIRPAGTITPGREDISLEAEGSYTSLAGLEETLVPLPGTSESVPLRDLAAISLETEDPVKSLVRQEGREAVVLAVNMKEGGRITVMGDQVRELTDRLARQYPLGVDFDFMIFQPELVSGLIDQFTFNVIQSILVVMAVMILASGFRSGMVVASLVPGTMIGSLLIMNMAGIGINQMSLASLIIVLGMLVDSGIVMVESMQLEIQGGKTPFRAAVDASRELRLPLLTSALTTSASFLPIAMAQNPAGEYTRPLFYVVTIALVLAWVLTITLIPFLGFLFLKRPGDFPENIRKNRSPRETPAALERAKVRYLGILTAVLRRRGIMIGLLVLALIVYLGVFRRIPVSFFPPTTYPYFTMEISLPRGTSIAATAALADQVDACLAEDLEGQVAFFGSFIGGGVPRFRLNIAPQDSRPEYAFYIVRLQQGASPAEIFRALRALVPEIEADAELKLSPFTYGPGFNAPVEIRISGTDREALYVLAEEAKNLLADQEGILNIRDDWGPRRKILSVEMDESSARRYGITHQDVAVSLQAASRGLSVSEYRGEETSLSIILKDSAAGYASMGDLESLNVYSETTGASVPLRQVARISLDWQPALIIQRDGVETITVQADVAEGVNAISAAREAGRILENRPAGLPRGFSVDVGGTSEGSAQANRAILEKAPIALFIIIMLLVVQFNSVRKSLIILVTVPFGFIGVVFGLWVTGSTFSFMSLLGLVSLSGVVVNDAIILLERVELEIREGADSLTALYRAALRKFRPILLTSVTTIAGLIPLMIFGGPLWLPMASALVFGLAFATVLTLGAVPALYAILFKVDRPEVPGNYKELL